LIGIYTKEQQLELLLILLYFGIAQQVVLILDGGLMELKLQQMLKSVMKE
jgi:hypothetical protein